MADQFNEVTRPYNNLTAAVDPTVTDDASKGYAAYSHWLNTTNKRVWVCLDATTGAAVWAIDGVVPGTGSFPSGVTTLFGGGAGAFPEEGNVSRQSSAAGIGNAADTTDDVLFTYTLPAASLDQANRQLQVIAYGVFAANANNKRVKLWFGATVVADTGVLTQNATGWNLSALITKTGALGSNTQKAQGQNIAGTVHGGCGVPTTPTETESGAIVIKVTGSSPTTGAANDVLGNLFEVNAMN